MCAGVTDAISAVTGLPVARASAAAWRSLPAASSDSDLPQALADPVVCEAARDSVPGCARAGDARHRVGGVHVHVGVRQGVDQLLQVADGAMQSVAGLFEAGDVHQSDDDTLDFAGR